MVNFLRKLLFIILFFVGGITQAQELTLKGMVLDGNQKKPIAFATVQVKVPKKNRLLSYTFTDKNGVFEIKTNLKNETDVSLVISYLGYTTYTTTLNANNLPSNLGKINLLESVESLNEVVITATPPILEKKDTMQYQAAAFKTKEDAIAEDLLKKLPGVSIDPENGNIQVNGADVSKILVNGEPFFSNNPKIAMKILSKDIIEKIEITNTKTDEESFTGSTGSNDTKTINITLKKKDNGNFFGNVIGGYGTQQRYETNGVLTRMHKKSLLTILAFSNNVNKNNFSYNQDEDANTLDNLNAIKTESNIGSNYTDKFYNGDRISMDYLFSDMDYQQVVRSNNVLLLPDRTNFSVEKSDQNTLQQIHRGNIKFTNTLQNNLRLTTNAQFFLRDKEFNRINNRSTSNEENLLTNTNHAQLMQQQNLQSLTSNLSAIYKFKKWDSYINYKIYTASNNNLNYYTNASETIFFGNNPRTVLRNQLTDYNKNQINIGNSFKYGQRFAKYHLLEYQVEHTTESQENTKEVLDLRDNLQLPNDEISFHQKIKVLQKQQELSYEYKKDRFYYTFKAKQLHTTLNNQELQRKLVLNTTFKDFLFSSQVKYKTPKKLFIYASYHSNSSIPKYHELLTITDNTNPTRITIGNPNLRREVSHLVSLRVRGYFRKSKIYFFQLFSYRTTQDKIIDKTTIDEDLITTKTYTNNNDNYQFSLNGNITKVYKKEHLFYSFKVKWHNRMGKNAHYINNVYFNSNYYRISPSFYTELNYNDVLEIAPYYRFFFNQTSYDNNAITNQKNTQHTFGLNLITFAPKRFTIFNQLQYNLNPRFETGFGKESLIWNITANYNIVPNKAKIKLKVFNLLNQYNNTARSLTESRNSTSTYEVLQQYAMLSFKYTFNN